MWIGQLFEDKTLVVELRVIPVSDITTQVKHEIREPADLSLQMLHCCETTVISEACLSFHADSAAPGQANPNEIVQPQIPTVLLEPGIVETSTQGALIGPQDWMDASVITAWQGQILQGLLKV